MGLSWKIKVVCVCWGRSQMSVDASFQFFEQVLSEYESNRYILNWQSAYISPFKGVSNTKLFFFQYFEKYFFSNTFQYFENLANPVKQSKYLKHICYYMCLTLASTYLKPNQLHSNQDPSFPATISWSHYCQLHKLHPYLYLDKLFLFFSFFSCETDAGSLFLERGVALWGFPATWSPVQILSFTVITWK